MQLVALTHTLTSITINQLVAHSPTMEIPEWFMLTDALIEADDGYGELNTVNQIVYLPANIMRCFERAPALAKNLLGANANHYLFTELEFNNRQHLLEQMLTADGAARIRPSNAHIVAYAALNAAVHMALQFGLPTDRAVIIRRSNLNLWCGEADRVDEAFDLLQTLTDEDLTRMRELLNTGDLRSLEEAIRE